MKRHETAAHEQDKASGGGRGGAKLPFMKTNLLHTVVKEGQAGVLVADEGALLDKSDKDLGLGEL